MAKDEHVVRLVYALVEFEAVLNFGNDNDYNKWLHLLYCTHYVTVLLMDLIAMGSEFYSLRKYKDLPIKKMQIAYLFEAWIASVILWAII